MYELTLSQINQIKLILQKQTRLLENSTDEELNEGMSFTTLAGDVHTSSDEAVAEVLMETRFNLADRRINSLNAIKDALQRIHDKTYGVCIDCGEPISFKRLQAYPMAKRCLDCKEIYESQQRQETISNV